MKTQWITHHGKRILLADYSNFGFDSVGALEEMQTAIRLATAEPLNSVLTLTDVRGSKVSPEMFAQIRLTANKIAPYAKRRAVVGVRGPQRFMLDLINQLPLQGPKPIHAFDELEAAKDWLVAEA